MTPNPFGALDAGDLPPCIGRGSCSGRRRGQPPRRANRGGTPPVPIHRAVRQGGHVAHKCPGGRPPGFFIRRTNGGFALWLDPPAGLSNFRSARATGRFVFRTANRRSVRPRPCSRRPSSAGGFRRAPATCRHSSRRWSTTPGRGGWMVSAFRADGPCSRHGARLSGRCPQGVHRRRCRGEHRGPPLTASAAAGAHRGTALCPYLNRQAPIVSQNWGAEYWTTCPCRPPRRKITASCPPAVPPAGMLRNQWPT